MRGVKLIVWLIFLGQYSLSAQIADTLLLSEVEVYGTAISEYSSGSKTVELADADRTMLDHLISDRLPVYFKRYGNGQLSTVAFRGTSALHTTVLWNSVPVNSPTLGQTDFSLWPSFLLDDVAVQYGSNTSLYGTGAIGGSLLLSSRKPAFTDKNHRISVMSRVGSFGQVTHGAAISYRQAGTSGVTKVFHHYLENDFRYPVKGEPHLVIRQRNAAVKQFGISQDLYFTSLNQPLALHAQLTRNDRQVQPSATVSSGGDELEDTNLRLALNHEATPGKGRLNNTLAYVVSDQYFYSNLNSRTMSQQFSGILGYELPLFRTGFLRLGTNVNHYIARTSSYYVTDWVTDVYAAFTFSPLPVWTVSLNMRQSLDNVSKPFAPGIGSEYRLIKNERSALLWKVRAGRAYRLPTLNERFWQPGGNPDLKTEVSLSIETGFSGSYRSETVQSEFDVHVFENRVNQWVAWLPVEPPVWSPENIKAVRVRGIEFGSSVAFEVIGQQIRLQGNYAYTASINRSGLTADDNSIGRQLPYVPEHQFNVRAAWEYKQWQAVMSTHYTGARFTTDDNSPVNRIDAFNLVNLKAGKSFRVDSVKIELRAESRNILNVYYENMINRAMPGRSYLFTFLFTF